MDGIVHSCLKQPYGKDQCYKQWNYKYIRKCFKKSAVTFFKRPEKTGFIKTNTNKFTAAGMNFAAKTL